MERYKSPDRKIPWSDLSVSSLEADIAYFDARLALLKEKPASYYEEAQIRAYKELEVILGTHLQRLRQAKSKTKTKKKKKKK